MKQTRCAFLLLLLSAAAVAQTNGIVEYPLPPIGSRRPLALAAGSDGNIWISQEDAGEMVRMKPDGSITEFGTSYVIPDAITNGPDGALWFTSTGGSLIGRMTTDGKYSSFPVYLSNFTTFSDITTGPDGNLWFVLGCQSQIYRMTTLGQLRGFPVSGGCPYRITAGPDGNMWATLHYGQGIARMSVNGAETEYTYGTQVNAPLGISGGADGNVWFVDIGDLRRITPSGVISAPLPAAAGSDLTMGPDGYLWVTEWSSPASSSHSGIGRVDMSGSLIGDFPTTASSSSLISLRRIVAGGDGRLWFGETDAMKIGAVTTTGVMTEYPLLTKRPEPGAMTRASDGNVWFVETNQNKIGRITLDGTVTEFPIPTPASQPFGIAPALDGNLWFTESNADNIGRITTDGQITEFPVQTLYGKPSGIVLGSDGNLWYTLAAADKIGKMSTSGVVLSEFSVGMTNAGLDKIVTSSDGKIWAAGSTTTLVRTNTTGGSLDYVTIPLFDAPLSIVAGADGSVWANGSDGFVRITQTFMTTKFSMNYPARGLTIGPDGAIWGTSGALNSIIRLTFNGDLYTFKVPFTGADTTGIITGSDGNIWFAEASSGRIGKLIVDKPITATGRPLCLSGQDFNGVVATFADSDLQSLPAEFTASIDWGDGATSNGVISATSPGNFEVYGQHHYIPAAVYTVTVTIVDVSTARDAGGGTARALSDTRFARVSGPGTFCAGLSQSAWVQGSPAANAFNWTIDGQITHGAGTASIVFVPYRSGPIHISVTVSDGVCTQTDTITATAIACSHVPGDASGDGFADVFWRNGATGENVLWMMHGLNSPATVVLPQVPDTNWTVAGLGDFDGDGQSDVLWTNTSGQVAIWLMNQGTLGSGAIVTTLSDTHWKVGGVLDLNSDSKADVVWRNEVSGQVVVWTMNGTSIAGAQTIGTVASSDWTIAAVARGEIFWRNTTTGQNVVWFMSGTFVSGAAFAQTVPDVRYKVIALSDSDSNGTLDVYWWNPATGDVVLWKMSSATTISSATLLATVQTDWHPEAAGTFGNFGFLWRNTLTGETVVWAIPDGANLVFGDYLPTVSNLNWRAVAPH